MTNQLDNFVISQDNEDSTTIKYNNFTIIALWFDYNHIELHRWEYRHREPKSFDVESSKCGWFDVCKIVGIDDCDTV